MTGIQSHPIEQLLGGGIINQGQQVYFTIQFQDGTEATMDLDHEKLGKLIVELIRIGKMAAEERTKHGATTGGEVITSDPFEADGIGVGLGFGPEGTMIAIRFLTKQKVPVDLVVEPELAKNFAESLQINLRKIQTSQMPKPH